MADNDQYTKSANLTLKQLRSLHAQISFTKDPLNNWNPWNRERQYLYILSLLLGKPTNSEIILCVDNFDNLDTNDHNSIFTHHYLPTCNGREELTAFYLYSNDEINLELADRYPNCRELLDAFRQEVLKARQIEPDTRGNNLFVPITIPINPKLSNEENSPPQNSILCLSNLPYRYKYDTLLNRKTKVAFLPPPSH